MPVVIKAQKKLRAFFLDVTYMKGIFKDVILHVRTVKSTSGDYLAKALSKTGFRRKNLSLTK